MDSLTVPQYTHMFNFTGNLLSNKFWWNTTSPSLPSGSYILTTSASFFSCSDGSDNRTSSFVTRLMVVRKDVYWTTKFTVGQGGTVPANTTGNSMGVGNSSLISAGMYDCTALRFSKEKVSAGLIGTYGAGILFTAIVMVIVRGKDPVDS
jgi:hypothetical protein